MMRPVLFPRGHWLLPVAIFVASFAAATPASAHELAMTTARVTLRDAHLDVEVDLDLIGLLARLAAADPSTLVSADDAKLALLSARAKALFESEARLEADGERVTVHVDELPPPSEVRGLAERRAASPENHGERTILHLEGDRSIGSARSVSLRLPSVAGEALIHFVQPATRWTGPGATAGFAVLEARTAPKATEPTEVVSRGLLAWVAAALGLAALISSQWARRHPKRARRPEMEAMVSPEIASAP